MNAVARSSLNSTGDMRPLRSAKPGLNFKSPMPGALIRLRAWLPSHAPATAPGAENHPSQPWGTSPLPAALLLAVVPLVLFGGPAAVSRPTAPVPIKPVQVEGVRVIRMDATTFRGRWMPINDMPPATVIHEVHELKGGDALSQEITGKPVEAVARPLPPARLVRRASLRPTDVCARHGQRKVTYTVRGYQHWRCRR